MKGLPIRGDILVSILYFLAWIIRYSLHYEGKGMPLSKQNKIRQNEQYDHAYRTISFHEFHLWGLESTLGCKRRPSFHAAPKEEITRVRWPIVITSSVRKDQWFRCLTTTKKSSSLRIYFCQNFQQFYSELRLFEARL